MSAVVSLHYKQTSSDTLYIFYINKQTNPADGALERQRLN